MDELYTRVCGGDIWRFLVGILAAVLSGVCMFTACLWILSTFFPQSQNIQVRQTGDWKWTCLCVALWWDWHPVKCVPLPSSSVHWWLKIDFNRPQIRLKVVLMGMGISWSKSKQQIFNILLNNISQVGLDSPTMEPQLSHASSGCHTACDHSTSFIHTINWFLKNVNKRQIFNKSCYKHKFVVVKNISYSPVINHLVTSDDRAKMNKGVWHT